MSEASSRCEPVQADSRRLRQIAGRLREANAVTSELLFETIRQTCTRLPSVRSRKDVDRLRRLIQCSAWSDAVLALLELELPRWRLRRIVYDDGEWHCALSRERELPDWLDQSIEASHADLALAILSAFVDVHLIDPPSAGASVPRVPCVDKAPCVRLCCDNFA